MSTGPRYKHIKVVEQRFFSDTDLEYLAELIADWMEEKGHDPALVEDLDFALTLYWNGNTDGSPNTH